MMNYKSSVSILFLSIFVLTISVVSAQDVNKIIKKVQKTYDKLDNLSATFVQTETFKITGSQTETIGKIYIKDGNQYRFESDDQSIVTDGKNVWTYNQISNQLLIDHMRENSGALLPRDLLFKYPQNHYATLIAEEGTKRQKVFVVRLDPKEGHSGFLSSIKLWIQDKSWHILKIETFDLGGNSSRFQIEDMDTQTKIPADYFSYTAPEGADVVDMRK